MPLLVSHEPSPPSSCHNKAPRIQDPPGPIISNAEMGGWWLICSMYMRQQPFACSACHVSPSSGLNGFFHDCEQQAHKDVFPSALGLHTSPGAFAAAILQHTWKTCCRPATNHVTVHCNRSTGCFAATAFSSNLGSRTCMPGIVHVSTARRRDGVIPTLCAAAY